MVSSVNSVSSMMAMAGTPKPSTNAPVTSKARGEDIVEISAAAQQAAGLGGDNDGDGD